MCSFVISWGEAWFLDFRVVPYEDKASLLLGIVLPKYSLLYIHAGLYVLIKFQEINYELRFVMEEN